MWLSSFLLARTFACPYLGCEPKVRVTTNTILELICFHHNVYFQFFNFLNDLIFYVLEMRTLGIYMSLEGYVSNSKYFWIVMLLKCDISGEKCFWKYLIVFSRGYIYGYPCYYKVMFWVHMFVEGHYFMKLCFRGLFLENLDFLSLCFSKSMFQYHVSTFMCFWRDIYMCVTYQKVFYMIVLDSKFHCKQVLNLSLYLLVFLLNAN